MDILDPTAPASQGPLGGGVVVVLLSYPVSLSAAVAAASVWTWLALAVAGAWLWRILSHQSARVKDGGSPTAESCLIPPDVTTATACLLQKPAIRSSPCPKDHEEREDGVEEIEPAACCRPFDDVPALPLPLLPRQPPLGDTACTGSSKSLVYFEGHGGCRRSPSYHVDEDDDEDDRVVKAPSGQWWRDGGAVRCWEDAHSQEEDEDDTADAVMLLFPISTPRVPDLGWRRFQDWGVNNGNVVRLWDNANYHHLPAAACGRAGGRVAVASLLRAP